MKACCDNPKLTTTRTTIYHSTGCTEDVTQGYCVNCGKYTLLPQGEGIGSGMTLDDATQVSLRPAHEQKKSRKGGRGGPSIYRG